MASTGETRGEDAYDDGDIAFSSNASVAELFAADEVKLSEGVAADDDDDGAATGSRLSGLAQPLNSAEGAAGAAAAGGSLVEEDLVADPFSVPSVDDDAFARDGDVPSAGRASQSSAAGASASAGYGAQGQHSESVLAAVDLLCDDLFHCKTSVLRNFARTRRVQGGHKMELVLRLLDNAHRSAHGENKDLSVTQRVLGDVFDDNVRTSGLRAAWTNKSLEASHIEAACERYLRFEALACSKKNLLVRRHSGEAARVLRKLTRAFQQEQEHISHAAVGGVFRNYRAAADELVRELPAAEVLSPFAGLLVAAIRYGASPTQLTRTDVNEKLVQLDLVRPAVQELDDNALLHQLMGLLDVAVQRVNRHQELEVHLKMKQRDSGNPEACVQGIRDFSEVTHEKWNTQAAPDWVHELASLFCNWEMIVRADLPRFEEVPRYFFDVLLTGVAALHICQRVYGDSCDIRDCLRRFRYSVRVALRQHFNNDEVADNALQDLCSYVQVTVLSGRAAIGANFFHAILSQMQGAFRSTQDIRSPLHDERVACILRTAAETASQCTRSAGLLELLTSLTEDLSFHFRFQRVYKKLSAKDRMTIRNKASVNLVRTLDYFEKEFNIVPLSTKAVGFLVVQLMYLSFRSDGRKRPVLECFTSTVGTAELDVVGLSEMEAVHVRDLHIAFPPQLSYNSWLDESDTREKSVYGVLPSVAVKGSANQAMIVSQAPMMKALDAISRVPWRINKYMLHVQEAIVREGFGFGKLRPGFYPLHYFNMSEGDIKYPSDRRRSDVAFGAEDSDPGADSVFNMEERQRSTQQRSQDWKALTELRSSRVHYLLGMRQARSILQFSHIYFPNSMDFRGRMYPLPGRLNHTGSDPFRGILEYAEPKPLGSVGLYWLKVHLANKMGMSKLSFDERVLYVDEHMEDVVQSAENPLQGDRWWQEASEPIQCLMACKEVADAMKCSQGPEKFLSRLPVAVDGSYNGLQHYSAIGRDAFGAALVNLVPSERPADAYTGILKEMLKSIEAEAARDHQVAQRCLGTGKGQDKDHIKRKTIKRPIMTQVYGVTGYGMSEQILDELVKQNKSHGLWTRTDMMEMAAYLRDKVLESLGVTFRETQNCRKWITEVTELLWRVQPPELRNALCWTTPLGLVVRQPYKVRNECSLFTVDGYSRVTGDSIAPASGKQLSAIAPNLIHSLDATHLAMTALEMQHRGLSMMAVHDSYWTYACDMPSLSQVLREQFVNLYSKYDPLWELKEQWEETYFMDLRRHGLTLPDPPKRGDLDLNVVLNSPYFFS